MRRVLRYCDYMADVWRDRIDLRPNLPVLLKDGTRAYALKQANMWNQIALKFASIWYRHLDAYGLSIEWSTQYVSAGRSALALHSKKKSTFLARLHTQEELNTSENASFLTESVNREVGPRIEDFNDLASFETVPSALLDVL